MPEDADDYLRALRDEFADIDEPIEELLEGAIDQVYEDATNHERPD